MEKVINNLSDEELAATDWITIFYEIHKKGRVIYRSKMAEIDCIEKEIKYEVEDKNLGLKKYLEMPFREFITEVKKDKHCCVDNFFKNESIFENDGPEKIGLSFWVEEIEMEPRKSEKTKYKLVSEIDAKTEKI